MSAPDTESQEQSFATTDRSNISTAAATAGSSSSQAADDSGEQVPPPPAAPQRRKMQITHDQYIQLQSMIVYHITEEERETGQGVDKDELIDWYLEQKENEMTEEDDIEYHTSLITKMLRKLVKVCDHPPVATACTEPLSLGQLPIGGEG